MNFKVEYTGSVPTPPTRPSEPDQTYEISRIGVSHSSAEMHIIVGETVITMPPATAKRLLRDLGAALGEYEAQHGKITPNVRSSHKESTVTRVVKALYKTRKLGPKLVSINTRKRKHLPIDSGDKK